MSKIFESFFPCILPSDASSVPDFSLSWSHPYLPSTRRLASGLCTRRVKKRILEHTRENQEKPSSQDPRPEITYYSSFGLWMREKKKLREKKKKKKKKCKKSFLFSYASSEIRLFLFLSFPSFIWKFCRFFQQHGLDCQLARLADLSPQLHYGRK